MVILKYRLVGRNEAVAVLERSFESRDEAMAWAKLQGNVMIVEIESSGVSAFSHIYGWKGI